MQLLPAANHETIHE